ncbi:MAG: LysR family transcriptional regulator [Streptococcaceae bacterium]|jgi:LysR family hydrogen peroxide-inducible transcriptional activator|nr:LysR family transcriptional regulator [Streptococcaceae bacterium]
MRIEQLKYFSKIAKDRNLTKAAAELYISQPSLSQSIKNFEEELGVKLFNRKSGIRQVELTPEGEIVERYTDAILQSLANMENELHPQKATITLGVPPIIGAYIFPKLVSNLSLSDFNSITFIEEGSTLLLDFLLKNKLDMSFLGTSEPFDDPNFEKYYIMRDYFSIIVSKNNPLSQLSTINFSDLKNQKFITLGKNFSQYEILKNQLIEAALSNELENLLEVNEVQTAKALIAANKGIGFLISSAVNEDSDLVAIPLKIPVYFYIYLLVSRTKHLSDLEKKIRDSLIYK